MQKELALKAMIKTVMESENRVEPPYSEKSFLLQTNKGILPPSWSTRSNQSRENRTLINSEPNQFICIAVQIEGVIHRRCSKEASEVRKYENENERNWKNPGETVGSLGVE